MSVHPAPSEVPAAKVDEEPAKSCVVDPATIIGKGINGKDVRPFTETKEYVIIPKCCIFLWAINPNNWWMLCGMEQRIVVEHSGDFIAFAACGNKLWSMNFSDLD